MKHRGSDRASTAVHSIFVTEAFVGKLSPGTSTSIMSTSGQDSITGKKRKPDQTARPPERSSFARTCNLLSQYVKGNGGLRGLNLAATGIGGLLDAKAKSESATMNLLSNMEVSARSGELANSKCASRENATITEPERTQMTMFYGGKVLVFDEIPADKAREIMLLAGCKATTSTTVDTTPPANGISPPGQDGPQRHLVANSAEWPIARKSSVHRFLGKRKERAVARGPHPQHQVQTAAPSSSSSSKNEEQLELKL